MKICNTCKHLKGLKCPAFPNGIPMPYLSGDAEHGQVIQGQQGETVWEAKGRNG